ncbi:acetolactate synthase large subunit [Saccharopolyspora sp. K220]|uniref:acetolactate synthase large subunit n=1 Tax=Saccharopolyspora soli TaxID=2926618 RepID=UPI001F56B20A|nr:acetolactate synthase large subunit [Saccharopolyspora soli]MCI2417597.1 acetolactate synthase large subunit [Saccharopolyspora soli]
MKGSESLLATATAAGVQVCFANPGTTEIPLVEAFDQVEGVRAVLALSEGVVTGAADGYARMTGIPAMTLLHLGPGLANGIANLHNARRARSPMINVIGEHATWHQPADAPLNSDIESLARPVSGWVGRTSSPVNAAAEFVEAYQATLRQRLPATLIAAADHMWSQGGEPAEVPVPPTRPTVDDQQVSTIAKLLSGGRGRPALLLGGHAAAPDGIRTAARIAATVGGEVFVERSPARIERGPEIPLVRSLPYFPEDVLKALDGYSHLVLVGARTPVAFFGYRGMPSFPVPNNIKVHTLADADQDAIDALHALAEATGSAAAELPHAERPQVPTPEGPLTAAGIAAAIVLTQPEHAILVNEGVSSGAAYPAIAAAAPPHAELTNTGGAIGMGMPVATGAAIACPDRSVINLQADGSAAYTVQALWTQARESLDVTTVICANSRYGILQAELRRAGIDQPGAAAMSMTSLAEPTVDWTAVARGFGVPSSRASTGAELLDALRAAHAEPGPHLVEAVL